MSYKRLKRILHRLPNSGDDDDDGPAAGMTRAESAAALLDTIVKSTSATESESAASVSAR